MNKEKLEKALNEIIEEYDAYLFCNKYGDENTHKEQFEILSELEGDKVENAILWIKNCYDAYYKSEYEGDDTAFAYLKQLIERVEENEFSNIGD